MSTTSAARAIGWRPHHLAGAGNGRHAPGMRVCVRNRAMRSSPNGPLNIAPVECVTGLPSIR